MNRVNDVRRIWSKSTTIKIAPILAIIALMGWALASPVGSSPDDDFHLTSIWCAAGEKPNACHVVADQKIREVPSVIATKPCFAQKAKQSAACEATVLNDGQSTFVKTSRGNFQNLYPPVFYRTMNLFVGSNIALSVFMMRIVNILLLVGLATALYLLLPASRRLTLVWELAITLLPLGLFLVVSTNPSAWAIISAGTFWISLLGYFESSGAKKAGLGAIAALSAILGAGARADAAVYVLIGVVVVVLLTAQLTRRWLMSAVLPFVLSVAAAVFYFSTRQSSVATSGFSGYASPGQHVSWRSLLFTDILNVPSLWAGVFGSWSLGWIDTNMPAIVSVGGLGCFAALAFAGLASLSMRKALVVVTVLGALWLLPTYILVQSGTVVGHGVQPRYILPLVTMLAGVVLLQAGGVRLTFSRGQVVALVSTLSVVNAVALYFNLRRYITGTDIMSWNLNSAGEWWWNISVSPMVVWIAGSLSFAAFLGIMARETLLMRPGDVPHQEVRPLAFREESSSVAALDGGGDGHV